ncbi:sigma-54-dependent Fis family transcriptional regulator [Effusibacillus lacus]|uniref:Sigma-54-dependent Fis family transcriptional regulator n=1 Tax=Effusibacillus lacus TaxID=1348429 RepID=A0A292YP71_9BACL|nr:sigma-54-dependent Fis family transcriptional regulator [Effusibacillus lacus]TCS71067.1 transcriptional regulator of acetoin/glycerol metabolism [Effusibacillus lacus]GAX90711.1 sigma-54-dependent Fis family transcriptional regulator [Effusibacillus lacus]
MENSQIAIRLPSDIHMKMKELEIKWKRYVLENHEPGQMRMNVFESWKRCLTYRVNPRQKQTAIALSQDELVEWAKKSNLYQISLPIVQHLADQISGTGHLVTLCDSQGKIIYLQGDPKTLQKAEQMNFVPGADWSEASAGTNAIGTSIAIRQPIQIFSYEHFCEGCHPWICSSAPIHDPFTGQLLGVIDLTGPSDMAQPHSLGIATVTATAIQQSYREISLKTRHQLQTRFVQAVNQWKSDPVIVLDAALQIVNAVSGVSALFQTGDLSHFWSLPGIEVLKNALLNNNGEEEEVLLPLYQLKITVQNIAVDSERIGFLLHLQRSAQHHSSVSISCNFWSDIIGESKAVKDIINKSQMVAPTNVPVLLTGESGTGKERFAQAIHRASLRHRAPFLAINCGAIPKELMASELFGYEPGTFTGGNPKGKAGKFEEANGGTLFLDEIGEMPLDLQVFLLRVLQEKEVIRLGSSKPIPVDVRIIAATNQNLTKLIEEGKFRADLYYRLNVVGLHLPPLRERKEDIPLLCDHFIRRCANKYGKSVTGASAEVLSFFLEYHWPGNLREMENVIEHAVLFASGEWIQMTDLPHSLPPAVSNEEETPLELEEKRMLAQLIRETNGNLSEVARRCKIARTTLYRKMQKYNMK